MPRSLRERLAWLALTVFRGLRVRHDSLRPLDPTYEAAVQRSLGVATGIGLLGGLSWLVLAYGHVIDHAHIDANVFYLPFLPLVFAMVAIRVQTVSLRAWPRRAEAHGVRGDVDEAARRPAPRSGELVVVGDGAR